MAWIKGGLVNVSVAWIYQCGHSNVSAAWIKCGHNNISAVWIKCGHINVNVKCF